ncbi:Ig-like domain-containing protein [Aldersonia sp. NBC_00410]|uniref:Ig-like domain-containing protein n=1 Tax=Aldersonia sp. NBC_00410 TaxID=2975954 RepID=UPI00225C05FA|nr:Ig-like domain-containing protein [Aldersonia sp. NBC_00410]MCX5043598.1 Ig-like domain-containing protein [Aldersonia sp. NBC_00410]
MSRRSLRGTVAATGAVAVAAGLALTGIPASAATVSFTNFCIATAPIVGNQDQPTATSVTVDAPATVTAGDTFTYRIQTAPSSYPDTAQGATTTNLSRLKFDFEIPANSTFVSATVVPDTGANLSGVTPNVLRVNNAGSVDPAGSILRLSGNNAVIANSPTSSLNSDGGIIAPKLKKNLDGSTNANGDSAFQLPAVDVTVVAGSAGTITPKVRVGGNAANSNADENYYTMLAKASLLGTQYAPTRCVPKNAKGDATLNAGGGPLATVNVTAAVPVDVATTTALTAPATATQGQSVTLSATVAPAQAGGTVQFFDGMTTIGAPVPVTAGVATLAHTFTELGAHGVTAVYSGATGFLASSSAAKAVNVTPAAVVTVPTATTLTVPATATSGSAVALSATVSPAPEGGTVQFAEDNTPIGGPVDVVGGVATLAHAFTSAGHHNITASYQGSPGFAASQSASATVDVSAPAPSDIATVTKVTALSTATVGKSVDLSATVSPASAGGTVQFMDGTDKIGGPVTVVNGAAILPHTFTTEGGHSITAVYSGAGGYVASTSAPFAVTASEASGGGTGSAGL